MWFVSSSVSQPQTKSGTTFNSEAPIEFACKVTPLCARFCSSASVHHRFATLTGLAVKTAALAQMMRDIRASEAQFEHAYDY